MPPTERKGRVHTSTVTVAVIEPGSRPFKIDARDVRIEWYSGTGAGGQHRNKHQNSCRITHRPTGVVATAQCRDRTDSKAEAWAVLIERLQAAHHAREGDALSALRKAQVGSGMRGDKVRTYREQDGVVTDHRTDRKAPLRLVEQGRLDLLG